MNGDSDGSEYVDNSEHESVGQRARGRSAKVNKIRLKNAGIKRETSPGSIVALEDFHNTNKTAKDADGSAQKIQNEVLRSYRDFLNSTIQEVHGPIETAVSDALLPAQIGISFWTTKEKHRLFAAIQSHGPGDLAALATAVGTKAEAEIKAYIILLQEGVRELDASATRQFGPADVPAAIEIQPESLQVEETLAAAVESRARAAEEAREQQRWGESSWLIDEDVAAAIDERFGNSNNEADVKGEVKNDLPRAHNENTSDEGSDDRPLSSDELLNASMLLQLSRSLFMNCKDPEMNWQTVHETGEDDARPSIRRTALDDFHNLVVSFTRRLMQASVFQALSRLRASTDPRLRPNVNGFDVAVARETMGLHPQRPEYWAAAVKRCGIEVYSDSKKYRTEGRQGTKIGFRLSEKELRAELGILLPDAEGREKDMNDVEEDDSDVESISSDAYTITSSSDHSAGEPLDDEPAVDSKGRPLRDRRRPLSPGSFHRAEAKFLNRLDSYRGGSSNEEYHRALGLPMKAEKRTREPEFPHKQADPESRSSDWRTITQYEAPWERPQGVPRQGAFDAMELAGSRRCKRRRLAASRYEDADAESADSSQEDANNSGKPDDAASAESNSDTSGNSNSDDEEDDEIEANVEEESGSEPDDE